MSQLSERESPAGKKWKENKRKQRDCTRARTSESMTTPPQVQTEPQSQEMIHSPGQGLGPRLQKFIFEHLGKVSLWKTVMAQLLNIDRRASKTSAGTSLRPAMERGLQVVLGVQTISWPNCPPWRRYPQCRGYVPPVEEHRHLCKTVFLWKMNLRGKSIKWWICLHLFLSKEQ